jgi:hypothetical protein
MRTSALENFDPSVDLAINTEAIAEANQLVYFLDLAHFEQAGRAHRGHVQLRKNTMTVSLDFSLFQSMLCIFKDFH